MAYTATSSDDWLYRRSHGNYKLRTTTEWPTLTQECTNFIEHYGSLAGYSQGNADFNVAGAECVDF